MKFLVHNNVSIDKACDIRIKTFKQPLFQKLSKTNTWLYSVPNDTQVSIICGNNVYNEILHESGLIKLEAKCKAKTNSILLKTIKIKNVTQTATLLEQFPEFNISIRSNIDMIILKQKEILELTNSNHNNHNSSFPGD